MLPDDGHRKIYELVVRRFLATFADPAVSESTRADIEAGTETYFVRGNVLVEPGFLAVYPYGRSKDEEIPKVEEGQELALAARAQRGWDEDRRDEPVGRREGDPAAVAHRPGQADRDDGGARPRHEGDAPRHHPEALRPRLHPEQPDRAVARPGIAMVKAFQRFAERVATPDMTAELEADMDKIASGEVTKDEVVEISRKMLRDSYDLMDEHKRELAEIIWEGMDQDRILGPVPEVPRGRAQERAGRDQPPARSSARRSRASASSAARATPTATRPTACRSAAT